MSELEVLEHKRLYIIQRKCDGTYWGAGKYVTDVQEAIKFPAPSLAHQARARLVRYWIPQR